MEAHKESRILLFQQQQTIHLTSENCTCTLLQCRIQEHEEKGYNHHIYWIFRLPTTWHSSLSGSGKYLEAASASARATRESGDAEFHLTSHPGLLLYIATLVLTTDRCLLQTLLSSTYLVLLDSSSTLANLCSGNSYEVRSLLMQDGSYLWKTSCPNFFCNLPNLPYSHLLYHLPLIDRGRDKITSLASSLSFTFTGVQVPLAQVSVSASLLVRTGPHSSEGRATHRAKKNWAKWAANSLIHSSSCRIILEEGEGKMTG